MWRATAGWGGSMNGSDEISATLSNVAEFAIACR
jgi:hypothetical protein